MSRMFCNYCGVANPDDSLFCRACGKKLSPLRSPEQEGTAQSNARAEAAPKIEPEKRQLGSSDDLKEITVGKAQPNGIGGWLALLVFGLLIGGPIALLFGIAQDSSPIVIFVCVGLGAWSIYCGIHLIRKKPNAPRIAKIFFITLFCLYALAIVVFILVGVTKAGSFEVDPAAGQTLGAMLTSIGWYAYLEKSKRVKNTYSRSSFTI